MKVLFILLKILLGLLFIAFISVVAVLFLYLLVAYSKVFIVTVAIVLLLIISYCVGSVLCMYLKSEWAFFSKFRPFTERLEGKNEQEERE